VAANGVGGIGDVVNAENVVGVEAGAGDFAADDDPAVEVVDRGGAADGFGAVGDGVAEERAGGLGAREVEETLGGDLGEDGKSEDRKQGDGRKEAQKAQKGREGGGGEGREGAHGEGGMRDGCVLTTARRGGCYWGGTRIFGDCFGGGPKVLLGIDV